MKTVQVSAIAALIVLAGSAMAQSSTYYPQCWFWQLPTNAQVTEIVAFNTTARHLHEKCVPTLDVVLRGDCGALVDVDLATSEYEELCGEAARRGER